MLSWSLNVFSHLGVFKPVTTENTRNKTTPKICKITVYSTALAKKIETATRQRAQARDLPSIHAPVFEMRDCLIFFLARVVLK